MNGTSTNAENSPLDDSELSLAFRLGELVSHYKKCGYTDESERLDTAYRSAAGSTGEGWTARFNASAAGAPWIMDEGQVELANAISDFNHRLRTFKDQNVK